jgi:hypothetical protein
MRAKWSYDQYEFTNMRYMGSVEGTLDFRWEPGCPGSRDTPAEGGYPDDLEPAISDLTLIDLDKGLEYVLVRGYEIVIIEINEVNTVDLMVEIIKHMQPAFEEIAQEHMVDRLYEVHDD